jgi:hypothetical protein
MKKLDQGNDAMIVDNFNRLFQVETGFRILEILMSGKKSPILTDEFRYWLSIDAEKSEGGASYAIKFINSFGQTDALKYNFLACYTNLLPHSNAYRDVNGATAAVICNELNVKSSLAILAKSKPQPIAEGLARIGLMVGDAHLPSMLPELSEHVDVMLLTDFDTLVTQHLLFQIACLRKANNYEEFNTLFLVNNPLIAAKVPTKNTYAINPVTGKPIQIGSSNYIDVKFLFHLLGSNALKVEEYSHCNLNVKDPVQYKQVEARFQRCKAAAHKMQFIAAPCDLFDAKSMQNLRSCLFDEKGDCLAEITYANFSNVHHYDGSRPLTHCLTEIERPQQNNKLMPNVRLLMAGQIAKPYILYSTGELANGNFQTLHSKITLGVDNYDALICANNTLILKAWDYLHPKAKNVGVYPTPLRAPLNNSEQKPKSSEKDTNQSGKVLAPAEATDSESSSMRNK